MTELDAWRHATPRLRDVFAEQVYAVGLALRLPAIVAAALVGVATLLTLGEFTTGGGPVDFAPELSLLPSLVGALLPIAVWNGEARFGASFLWTLPVDRRALALSKVAAGWVWLMTTLAALTLWLLLLALVTGGDVLGAQLLRVLPTATVPPPGVLDPAALRLVRWTPQPLFWLVPFTSATAVYALASALALGTRHPLRWLAGVALGAALISAAGSATHSDALRLFPSRAATLLNEGPYGLDVLLSARTESLHTQVTLATGRTVGVWRGLPSAREWATVTALWTTLGLLALWAAASRHGDRRRG